MCFWLCNLWRLIMKSGLDKPFENSKVFYSLTHQNENSGDSKKKCLQCLEKPYRTSVRIFLIWRIACVQIKSDIVLFSSCCKFNQFMNYLTHTNCQTKNLANVLDKSWLLVLRLSTNFQILNLVSFNSESSNIS